MFAYIGGLKAPAESFHCFHADRFFGVRSFSYLKSEGWRRLLSLWNSKIRGERRRKNPNKNTGDGKLFFMTVTIFSGNRTKAERCVQQSKIFDGAVILKIVYINRFSIIKNIPLQRSDHRTNGDARSLNRSDTDCFHDEIMAVQLKKNGIKPMSSKKRHSWCLTYRHIFQQT